LTWRIIAHLSLNFFSLAGLPSDGKMHDATVIRELLRVYAEMDPRTRICDGGSTASSEWVAAGRRAASMPKKRPAFARGVELTLEVDPRAFDGSGVFLFGSVMNCFLSRMASMNSFVEMVLRTTKPSEREVSDGYPK